MNKRYNLILNRKGSTYQRLMVAKAKASMRPALLSAAVITVKLPAEWIEAFSREYKLEQNNGIVIN